MTAMPQHDLAGVLRGARRARAMTLRDVERATGIGNAHLSQLETGKIRKPDLSLLWELARLYELEFEELIRLAGHRAGDSSITVAMRALGDLTADEREDVIAYMARLRRRRGRNA
jgi:transcriptional regulator with XRE-family HTH domain